MLQHKTISDRTDWNEALAALPGAHVLQSWDWGDFKSRWGWRAERLLWLEADVPVAAAQVLQRTLPGTPWNFLYVSKGPVLDYHNVDLATAVLADLEAYGRQKDALFIKIDPDVVHQYGEPHPSSKPEANGQAMLDLL